MSILNRRDFAKSIITAGVGAAVCRWVPNALASTGTAPAGRAFEMLAIGDSVIWGQGLNHENKFTFLVSDWLQKEKFQSQRDSNLYYGNSHSGATIFSKPDKKPHPPFHGEVNVSNPTILEQVERSVKYYKSRPAGEGGPIEPESVDLVLANGGINDMGALSLVNLLFRKVNLIGAAKKYCEDGIGGSLLPKIAGAYPNARIIVTGYFPLLTDNSDPRRVWEMLLRLFPDGQIAKVVDDETIDSILSKPSPLMSKLLKHLPNPVLKPIIKECSSRSKVWYDASNAAIRRAVDRANLTLPVTGSVGFGADNPRTLFARVEFNENNGFAAPEPFLWELDGFKSNDEMYASRQTLCSVVSDDPGNLITCHRAGLFHPNRSGAKAYASAIKDKIDTIFDKTGWAV